MSCYARLYNAQQLPLFLLSTQQYLWRYPKIETLG